MLTALAILVLAAARGRARLRLVRGGLAADARARGAGRRAARRARRAADRAPLRLPPRPALARGRRRPARSGVGARAAARPRRRHRRPALAPARPRAASTRRCAGSTRTSCSETTTSPSRATRSRGRRSSTGSRATLLVDESSTVDPRGVRVQVAGHGAAPRRRRCRLPDPDGEPAASCSATTRGCRVPGYQLVLAGHMHAGQIVLPYPGGKLRFAHLRAPLTEGLYRHGGVTLHVSPGLGTTFVPFRFFARPEVTELVLQPSLTELLLELVQPLVVCRDELTAERVDEPELPLRGAGACRTPARPRRAGRSRSRSSCRSAVRLDEERRRRRRGRPRAPCTPPRGRCAGSRTARPATCGAPRVRQP